MKIVILGNGITGITTARTIRQLSDHDILVVSGETDHFFSRTALMYIYMGHMRYKDTKPYEDWFWEKNRIELKRAWIAKVDFDAKVLQTAEGESIPYDKLVLATGSKPNKFGWPGQDLEGVQGLYSFQDLESLEERSKQIKHAVIVGGGLIGIELAEMLHSRHIPVTFLVREKSFWNNVLPSEESDLINRHIRAQSGIDLRLATELKAIHGEGGKVSSVETSEGEMIDCQFVGLTAGVSPNIDFLKETQLATNRGILVDRSFQTNQADVYAGGDCAQFNDPPAGRRPIEQVWYTGRMHGEIIAKNICENDGQFQYKPGPWFNSAKFFDIEYQTYGDVPGAQIDESKIGHVYWEHSSGMKALHICFDLASKEFLGMNAFGLRYRHHLLDKWLRERQSVKYVVANLQAANFDPEFFKAHEADLIAAFNAKYPELNIRLKERKGISSFLNLMKS